MRPNSFKTHSSTDMVVQVQEASFNSAIHNVTTAILELLPISLPESIFGTSPTS